MATLLALSRRVPPYSAVVCRILLLCLNAHALFLAPLDGGKMGGMAKVTMVVVVVVMEELVVVMVMVAVISHGGITTIL